MLPKSVLALISWRGELGKAESLCTIPAATKASRRKHHQAGVPFGLPVQDVWANGIMEHSVTLPQSAPVN